MSIHAIYRACIWLPILVPAVLIVVVTAFELRDVVGWVGEAIGFSLYVGGLPYAALAIWATRWVGGRSEAEIRRLMFLAPVIMAAVFVPLAMVMGVASGLFVPWFGVAALGTGVIIPLGYAYVGVAMLLRHTFGPRTA